MKYFILLLATIMLAGACKKTDFLQQPTALVGLNPSTATAFNLTSFKIVHTNLRWEGQSLRFYSLKWTATGEASFLLNYEVQYSASNNNFVTTSTEPAASTDLSTTHSKAIDYAGYYRLKINLLSGNTQYSAVVRK